jgi:hypothetical protein
MFAINNRIEHQETIYEKSNEKNDWSSGLPIKRSFFFMPHTENPLEKN